MKIFRKGFLALLLLVVVLFGVVNLFLVDGLFAGALRRFGPHAAGGQPVEFQDASVALASGGAEILGLQIGPSSEPMIESGRVAAAVSPWALLGGSLQIEEAVLEDTLLRLVVDENGRFRFDPGPPPPGTEGDGGVEEERTPAQDRDVIEIVEEYWERLQRYKKYYDQVGIFGGDDEEGEDPGSAGESEEEEAKGRERWAGRPAYLQEVPETGGGLWIGHAGVENLHWETLDERTGQPILPAVNHLSLLADRLGTAPAGVVEPATLQGEGEFASGGRLSFLLEMSRTGEAHGFQFKAEDLPSEMLAPLVRNSVPYRLRGGTMDFLTRGLQFTETELKGSIRLVLRGVELKATRKAPDLLGLSAQDFADRLSQAAKEKPLRIDLILGGNPTSPSFELKARNLDELLLGVVEDEVRDRAGKLIDQEAGKLLDGKADGLLEGEGAGDLLQGVLGGKDKEQERKKKRREKRRQERQEKENSKSGQGGE